MYMYNQFQFKIAKEALVIKFREYTENTAMELASVQNSVSTISYGFNSK